MNSSHPLEPRDLAEKDLKGLFKLADKVGKRRYHKLTAQDFEHYRAFDHWRYVEGDYECGTTPDSRQWVYENSSDYCPVCDRPYSSPHNGKTIDHKLPRAQYPWLSMDFRNFWVICRSCNQSKGERHWYEYERYTLKNHGDRYASIQQARPTALLKSLSH